MRVQKREGEKGENGYGESSIRCLRMSVYWFAHAIQFFGYFGHEMCGRGVY